MTSLTYTANNRDGQTWLVCPDKPDILLTDHLPDGTKVRGDEIVLEPQYYLSKSDEWIYDTHPEISKKFKSPTRQVATLKKMRFEAVGIDDEITNICDWLSEKYNHDFTAEDGRFYKVSRLSIAELIIKYEKFKESKVG